MAGRPTELCGVFGVRVVRRGELQSVLESALEHPRPALVEVISEAEFV